MTAYWIDAYGYENAAPDIELLIATRSGLFLLSNGKFERIIGNKTYGITKYKNEWWVSISKKVSNKKYNEIVSFSMDNKQPKIRLKNLPTGIHQIDFINSDLVITDTENNKLRVYKHGNKEEHRIICPGEKNGRNHFNSVFSDGYNIYVLAHNRTIHTKNPSRIYKLSMDYKFISKNKTGGSSSHNYYTDGYQTITLDSQNGRILHNKQPVFVDKYSFFRGLSVSDDYIIIGASKNKYQHRVSESKIFIFDKDFNLIHKFVSKNIKHIMEIRRVDKIDYAMSRSGGRPNKRLQSPHNAPGSTQDIN